MLTAGDWAAFEAEINGASNPTLGAGSFSNKPVIWRRAISTLDDFREDNGSSQDIPLICIPNYNYMRSWPITVSTETGQLDKQSIQLLFNKTYLAGLGYLNADGYFDYNPARDLFILDGLSHICVGDTPVASSLTDDLFISIIILRDKTQTGEKR